MAHSRSAPLVAVASILAPALAVALTGCGGALLPVGAMAPDLGAVDQNGASHRMSAEHGHPVVVYFYPMDATPGCTKEACAFRDAWTRYQTAGVQVFGVSEDDAKSHDKFAKKENLPFPLLVDVDQAWIKGFGVPTRIGMATRVTFLVDGDGKIAKVYPHVDPALHADEVLGDAAALTKGAAPPPVVKADVPAK